LNRRIQKRAYELYEQGGRKDGGAVENWNKAESEVHEALAQDEVARPIARVS
jgi:hypothetical protein